MKRLFFLLFLALLTLPAMATAQDAPLRVVATFSILGDLTQQIGGDLVEVQTLVGPDGDAHNFKPTPGDSRRLLNADLVVENGLGFEGWTHRLIEASGFKGPVVIASEGVTPREMDEAGNKIFDPHAWQNVENTRLYVRNIAHALTALRPDAAQTIQLRAKNYDAELQKLDAWVKAQIATVPPTQRKIITSHDAFGYFGAAYGVTFMAPQGINTDIDPTATQVARLIAQLKAEKVKRVFFENMANPKLMKQLAHDVDADVGKPVYSDSLSAADGPAGTYINMFRYNVAQFKEALALNGK